jgi:hypothetical protein
MEMKTNSAHMIDTLAKTIPKTTNRPRCHARRLLNGLGTCLGIVVATVCLPSLR